MRLTAKRVITILLVVLLMTTTIFSATVLEKIEVARNLVKLEVDGQIMDTQNFLYKGTTYVPIRAVAESIGAKVTWDQKTKTAGIVTGSTAVNNNSGNVSSFETFSTSPYEPTVKLSVLGITKAEVDLVVIRDNGELVPMSWNIINDDIKFTSAGANYGQNVLALSSEYTLDVYKKNGAKVSGEFTTYALPSGIEFENDYQVIIIPAMPEKGFKWPYAIVIPPNRYANDNNNATSKRYLMVEGINNGSDESYESYKNKLPSLYANLQDGATNGLDNAIKLMMPYIMPLIPRPQAGYNLNGDYNSFYSHALDRDTAIMDQLLDDPQIGENYKKSFEEGGFNPDDFRDLTGQTTHMIEHGLTYLNGQGFGLEDRVMMYGYSAQGTFDDRFATLNPELIKAYASGGTLDDLILPLASYKGDDLIFPIGVSDYKNITGNMFDLDAHNQVARLIYMGKDDTNDVTKYSDCYGDIERNLIYKHFGTNMLQRAISLTNLYGESGGKGMFILDVGEGHGQSSDMRDYVIEFYMANRDSVTPEYPTPSNPNKLEYTVFE